MFVMLAVATALLAQATGPALLSETSLHTKIINIPESPVYVDSCRASTRFYDGGFIENAAYVILHNTSKKSIEVIGFSLIPFTAFNDRAGEGKMSHLSVDLAPGDTMGEDYKFTDGAKEPLMGGMGSAGKWQEWTSVYSVTCVASRIRFSDGSVWPSTP
jgi:hypothetical protein